MNLIFTILIVLAALSAFGVPVGVVFLVLYFLEKDQIEKKKFGKWFLILILAPVILVTGALFARGIQFLIEKG